MTREGGRCGALPLQARGFQAVLGCTDRVCPPGADSRQATGPLLTPALRPPTHGAEEMPAGQPGLPSLRGHCLGGAPGAGGLCLRCQVSRADTYITTSRDMLNIVLGTTLGLNVAVVQFFGDYLDLEC